MFNPEIVTGELFIYKLMQNKCYKHSLNRQHCKWKGKSDFGLITQNSVICSEVGHYKPPKAFSLFLNQKKTNQN